MSQLFPFSIAAKVLQQATLDDYILLPATILGSLYVYNRGSFWAAKDPWAYKWYEVRQASLVNSDAKPKKSRNIAQRLQESQSSVAIFWGSQSGTSEGFAHRLARDLEQRFDIHALVVDVADFDAPTLTAIPASARSIFLVSTYGEGDPSDNAQDFVSWMRTQPSISLGTIRYACFGCGNSNYKYFNKVADDLTLFLDDKGATPMIATGKGDEANRTTEEDFLDWKETLMDALAIELGLMEVEKPYEPGLVVDRAEDLSSSEDVVVRKPICDPGSKNAGNSHSEIVKVEVSSKIQLAQYASETGRSCIEISLDLTPYPQVKYKTGDHIALWPENPEQEVSDLINILKLGGRRDELIQIKPRFDEGELKVPSPATIEALFRNYLEICSPVARETVLRLANLAPTAAAKSILLSIGESKEKYVEFLTHNHMTISRLLSYAIRGEDPSAVSWQQLPLAVVLDLVPPMKPRLYSISSSRITSPRHVSLTVSVKPTPVPQNPSILIPGLTSTYLQGRQMQLQDGVGGCPAPALPETLRSSVWAQIRSSGFKLPVTSTTPLVMVAAGTGIAPLRAFIQERFRLKAVGREIGQMILFFGCQNEDDYLYKGELQALAGDELQVVPAFSRAASTKKMYVQNVLEEHRKNVGRLMLDGDAAFYICGAATMAKEVNKVLIGMVRESRGWSERQAENWRMERKSSKRWFEDVWS